MDAHGGGASKGSVIIAFACVTLGLNFQLFCQCSHFSISSASFYMGTVGPHMMSLLKARISAAVIYKTIDEAIISSPFTLLQFPLQSISPLTVGRTDLNFRGDIVFEDVQFKYASRDSEVLKVRY